MRFPQKIFVALCVLLLTGARQLRADEPPAVQVNLDYASRYVFRGVERAGASAQAAVEFARDEFHVGVTSNQPFRRGETRDLNLHATYTWQPASDLKLEASVAQDWFEDVPGGGADHSTEAGLDATFASLGGFTPGLAYYHDFRFRSDTAEFSVARSIALTKWGTFLDLNFLAGWAKGEDWRPDAAGPRAHDSYAYWGGEARLPYRIGAHSTVMAGLHYQDAFGRSLTSGPFGRPARRNLWVSLGVNLDF